MEGRYADILIFRVYFNGLLCDEAEWVRESSLGFDDSEIDNHTSVLFECNFSQDNMAFIVL